jgi:hypothetical protein
MEWDKMRKEMLLVAVIIAIMALFSVGIALPPPPDGSYSPPAPDGSQYPSYPPGYPGQGNQQYPSDQQGTYPPGQGTQPGQATQSGQGPSVEHPSSGPQSEQPQSTPSASTGTVAENLGQGQSISKQQVTQLGGEPSSAEAGGKYMAYLVTGLEQWALYNGQWTKNPSAVNYYGRMNLLVNNDQSQYLWSYEKYPNGYEDWHNWGYLYSGYYNRIFLGDATGWHQVAVWGSQSGWSNVLWIYVWGP